MIVGHGIIRVFVIFEESVSTGFARAGNSGHVLCILLALTAGFDDGSSVALERVFLLVPGLFRAA